MQFSKMVTESILFISYSGLWPATDGKRQRTYALITALSARYHVDYLIINNQEDFAAASSGFKNTNVSFLSAMRSKPTIFFKLKRKLGIIFIKDKSIQSFIEELCCKKNYSFIFSRYIHPVRQVPPGIKLICDVDDDFIEKFTQKIRNKVSIVQSLRFNFILYLNYLTYRMLLKRANHRLFVKESDLAPNSTLVPNIPMQLTQLSSAYRFHVNDFPRLLFVGKLSYSPNARGLDWFLEQVWNNLVVAVPGIQLTVVSSAPAQDIRLSNKLNAPGITYLGLVENLEEVYRASALIVVPILEGAGSSIKVAEALYFGRPVVATEFGARGHENQVKEGFIFSTDKPTDFAQYIIHLMRNPIQLNNLQAEINDWAKDFYSFKRWQNELLEAVVKI